MTDTPKHSNSKDPRADNVPPNLERPAMTRVKYRPPLSNAQILHILTLCKSESPSISDASIDVIATLGPYQYKIENSGVAPAYTTTPQSKVKLFEKITGSSIVSPLAADGTEEDYILTKEDYWRQCYHTLQTDPNECSLKMIQAAKEHMYLNDLMSEEELKEFESNE